MVHRVFPNIAQNYTNHQWLNARAILAVKNDDVNAINFSIQNEIPGEATAYKSIDIVMNQDEVVNYATEFLNSLDLPGLSPHILTLKIDVPIILLRNVNPPRLCNGTRLSVKKMMNNIIEATILNVKFKGEDFLLPRIPMIKTDAIRIQTSAVSGATRFCNDHQQGTRTIASSEWTKFGKSMLLTWTWTSCMWPARVGKPSDLFVYARDGKTKNIFLSKSTAIKKIKMKTNTSLSLNGIATHAGYSLVIL